MYDTMETIHYLFRMLAASQALLLVFYMLAYQRNAIGSLVGLLCLGFFSYLVLPFSQSLWGLDVVHHIFIFFATSIPALLWWLAHKFFCDEKHAPIWFWLSWLLYLGLALPNWETGNLSISAEFSNALFYPLPQLIKLGFVLHVIYLAFDGRANDLVSQRLKLRIPVAVGASVITAVVILVELWTAGQIPVYIEEVGAVAMFAVAMFANLYLFRLRSDLSFSGVVRSQERASIANEDNYEREIRSIEQTMNEQRFYAIHGATIGDLADHLDMQAYRLRTVINQRLGYRNFNQFLNHYRVAEAAERLLTETRLPILTIALDTGFNSVSSFNKAFKDTHNQTPSAYRGTVTTLPRTD